MFISPRILGHYYIAELNPKTGDKLKWSLVPAVFDGKIIRIPFRQVPRKIYRQAYRQLIELIEP